MKKLEFHLSDEDNDVDIGVDYDAFEYAMHPR